MGGPCRTGGTKRPHCGSKLSSSAPTVVEESLQKWEVARHIKRGGI